MTATKLSWTKTPTGYQTKCGRFFATRTDAGRFNLNVAGKVSSELSNSLLSECKDEAQALADGRRDTPTGDQADLYPETVKETMAGEKVVMSSNDWDACVVSEPIVKPTANGALPRNGQHRAPTVSEDEANRMGVTDPVETVKQLIPGVELLPAQEKVLRDVWASGVVVPPTGGLGVMAKLAAAKEVATSGPPHVVVEALAGVGKTATLVGGIQTMMGLVPRLSNGNPMVPSPQQKAVWDALAESRGASSVAFLAFNKSIATELQTRLTGLRGVEAMTNHSLGMRAVNRSYRGLKVDQYRVPDLIAEVLGADARDLRFNKPVLLGAASKLVSLCKMNLVGLGDEWDKEKIKRDTGTDLVTELAHSVAWGRALDELCDHYDVDLTDDRTGRDYRAEVFGIVPQVLELCRDVDRDRRMDFDDMIWLPVALDLPVPRYDVVLVDEAQDLNRCQQELIRRAAGAGGRVVLCGDRNQAIYGFAGADSESLPRMTADLGATPRGVTVLPLTVTRRCGRAIVEEAKRIVPAFEAHESNPDGEVRVGLFKDVGTRKSYRTEARDGDMVICRTNAPLVVEVFKFIRAGRKANIMGRDIGKGLTTLVEKSNTATVEACLAWLELWREKEVTKEMNKRHPSETKLTLVNDKADCLICFGAELDPTAPVRHLTEKIESVFTDDRNGTGVRLSSIHKAKGLEAEHVFILRTKGFASKREWMAEQETNLRYVAITRAVRTLTFVDLPSRTEDE